MNSPRMLYVGRKMRSFPREKPLQETDPASPAFKIAYFALFALAVFLLFYNLGDRLLWGDEAETANLAVNITKFGWPKTFDGKNTISLYGPQIDAGASQTWLWSPWLDEYLAALSFSVFGPGTSSARLPFVILAMVSLLFFGRTVRRIFRDRETTLAALMLLLSSEIFILHSRQCRYYALTLLAQIWILSAFHRALDPKHKRVYVALALALAMQFYSNYINALGNAATLILTAIIMKKRFPSLWRAVIRSSGLLAALAAPWLYFAKTAFQTRLAGQESLLQKWGYYLSEIHFHLIPWAVFFVPLIVHLSAKRRAAKNAAWGIKSREGQAVCTFLGILFPVHLFVASLAPGIYWRYILPLVPGSFLLAALIIRRYFKSKYVRTAVLLLLALTNILSITTLYPFRGVHHLASPVVRISRAIASPYRDRLEDVVEFFKNNGNASQSVYVFDPEFPLIFYTGMKIIDGRMAGGKVTEPLPDWILAESASGVLSLPPIDLPAGLKKYYQPMAIEVHDSRRGGSIPEPDAHEYFTTSQKAKIVVFKKNPEVRPERP